MRVPTRSDGTRSGVNCTRENDPPRTLAVVLIVSVFASPGTPSRSRWPSESRQTRTRSSIASCPAITRRISNSACSRRSFASPGDGAEAWSGCSLTLRLLSRVEPQREARDAVTCLRDALRVRDGRDRPVRLELLEALLARERYGGSGVVDQAVLRQVLERRRLQVVEETRRRPSHRRRPLERTRGCGRGCALHRGDVARSSRERGPLDRRRRALDKRRIVRVGVRQLR